MAKRPAKPRKGPSLRPRTPSFTRAEAAGVDAAAISGILKGGDRKKAAANALLAGPFGEDAGQPALLAQRLRRVARLAPKSGPLRERLREIAVLRGGREGGAFLLKELLGGRNVPPDALGLGPLRLDTGALRSLRPDTKRVATRLAKRAGLPLTLGLAAALAFLARRYRAARLPAVARRCLLAARKGDMESLDSLLPTPAAALVRVASPRARSRRPVYWPGLGGRADTEGFLALARFQAMEGRHTYGLASRVSRTLKVPVVLLCNASLASSVGWSIPGFHLQVGPGGGEAFVETVERKERLASLSIGRDAKLSALVEGMAGLFRARIAAPALAGALCDLGALAEARKEPSLLDDPLVREAEVLSAGAKREHLAPNARPLSLIREELGLFVGAFRRRQEVMWPLFSLLGGLLAAGEESLPPSGLVVPWIDKFFMSSRREKDIDYLISVCLAVKRLCPKTIVILVDDTKRKIDPSLKRAINNIKSKGYEAEGLMVFGDGAREPFDVISARGAGPLFYAVRPFLDTHNPKGFLEMIRDGRDGLLTPDSYDSSWKDGLDFLYSGTDVEPLAARPGEEGPRPYLFMADGMVPAGALWRSLLMSEAPGPDGGPLRELWRRWAGLAGLG